MKPFRILSIVLLLASLAGVSAMATTQTHTMTVAVEKAAIRDAPSFVAQVVATVPFGTRIVALGQEGGWVRVVVPGSLAAGYLPLQMLVSPRIPATTHGTAESGTKPAGSITAPTTPGAVPTGALPPEIVLAGKGFDTTLESLLGGGKSDSSFWEQQLEGFNFTAVDTMESLALEPEECLAFLLGLETVEGAR
ncbi:MAG: SH3 domain-containing protein [Spirochaetales bacterium]|nr:SH3 domain-containing protein [Spirochaetales bacterium]